MADNGQLSTITPIAIRPLLNRPDPNIHYLPRPGAYAIILNAQGELLTLETETGVFLPGGGQDPGESLLETLVREGREELGVSMVPINYLLAADDCRYSPLYQQHFQIQAHYFYAEIASDAVFVTEPKMKAVWRPLSKAVRELTRSNDRWFVPLLTGGFQIQLDPSVAVSPVPLASSILGSGPVSAVGASSISDPALVSGLVASIISDPSLVSGLVASAVDDPTATFLFTHQETLTAWVRLSFGKTHYQVEDVCLGDQVSTMAVTEQLQTLFDPIKIIDPSGLLAFNA